MFLSYLFYGFVVYTPMNPFRNACNLNIFCVFQETAISILIFVPGEMTIRIKWNGSLTVDQLQPIGRVHPLTTLRAQVQYLNIKQTFSILYCMICMCLKTNIEMSWLCNKHLTISCVRKHVVDKHSINNKFKKTCQAQ